MYQKKGKHFYSCSSPNNKFFLQLPLFSCCFVFTSAFSTTIAIHSLPLTHFTNNYYIKGELLLSKCNCILVVSYPLSPPFPFDHNYTWRRVKWGEHGMGPMQHWLTTATPFKSQKILFKSRLLGSNLIHRRLSTSQLPIWDPPSPVTWFTSFFSPVLPASRGFAIHVFLVYKQDSPVFQVCVLPYIQVEFAFLAIVLYASRYFKTIYTVNSQPMARFANQALPTRTQPSDLFTSSFIFTLYWTLNYWHCFN